MAKETDSAVEAKNRLLEESVRIYNGEAVECRREHLVVVMDLNRDLNDRLAKLQERVIRIFNKSVEERKAKGLPVPERAFPEAPNGG